MQHVPEGVIQAPESPDAPEALPGCRSISDDDLCAWCTRLLYRPGEISLCRLSIQAMASGHPSVTEYGYAYGCPEFQPNIIHP
ncbi:hypothetical protein QT322_22005 [Escherichia coli]|nr:hypothetical protein [Escherichia coli]